MQSLRCGVSPSAGYQVKWQTLPCSLGFHCPPVHRGQRHVAARRSFEQKTAQIYIRPKSIGWVRCPGRRNSLAVVNMAHADLPPPRGLYDPGLEKDSCGVGFIAELDGVPKREVVALGLEMLDRLKHRGACGCEENTGDGAGISTNIPHKFFQRVAKQDAGIDLPPPGDYAIGMVYLPRDPEEEQRARAAIEEVCKRKHHTLLGWRKVPVNNSIVGASALATEPQVEQFFVTRSSEPQCNTGDPETEFFDLRKGIERLFKDAGFTQDDAYICSLSGRCVIYKGQLIADQVGVYYPDLQAEDFASTLIVVHSRFSTNTFPSWARAQPHRIMAHNGEINTLRGNKNWMKARQGGMMGGSMGLSRERIDEMLDIISPEQSDSGSFDAVLELLVRSGRDLPEAMMVMIPEAWQGSENMSQEKKDFYRFHSCIMEPWDGPALVACTDGRYVGATLDRNGLRPGRYYRTATRVVMASEVGVVDTPSSEILEQGRLRGGNILFVDLQEGCVITDEELKAKYCNLRPYGKWLEEKTVMLEDIVASVPRVDPPRPLGAEAPAPASNGAAKSNGNGASDLNGHGNGSHNGLNGSASNGQNGAHSNGSGRGTSSLGVLDNQGIRSILKPLKAFGYTQEELEMLLAGMGAKGHEELGSMGNDAPLAFLSRCPQLTFNYFKQLFAQVTNPPLDCIREKLVTSVRCMIGPEGDVTALPQPSQAARLDLLHPILTAKQMDAFKRGTVPGLAHEGHRHHVAA
eukprot:jgi/Botrbrau1/20017/Bobra.200_1s0023.1